MSAHFINTIDGEIINLMNYKMIYISLISFVILGIGLVLSIYVLVNPPGRDGLELIGLLPALASCCVASILNTLRDRKISVCIYLYLIVLTLRYVVMPLLLSLSNGYLHFMRNPGTKELNQYAVFVLIIELITMWLSLKFYIPRYDYLVQEDDRIDSSRIRFQTLAIIIVVLGICLIRYDRFIENIHFFNLSSTESVGSYEQIALQVIKSYVCVRIIIYLKNKYEDNRAFRYVIYALLVGVFNCGVFFGINRSLILQTAIATITMLINQFPNHKRLFLGTTIPAVTIMILGITLLRHFNTTLSTFGTGTTNINTISETVEGYCCGPWSITSSVNASNIYRHELGLFGMVSDFVCNFFPFMLPGLNAIREYFLSVGNTSLLFNSTINYTGSMIPMIGQCNFYFGMYFGIVADVFLNIWCMKILARSCFRAVRVLSVEMRFYYTWLSSLFAFSMCYCLITFTWSWSKFGMIFLFMSWLNRKTVITGGRNLLSRGGE